MKYLFAVATTAFLLTSISCKKEEVEACPAPLIENTPNYMPLAIGNYWVYNDYKIDTLGNETKMSYTDSIYVQGDTIIEGDAFFVIKGSYQPKLYPSGSWILRDSSGYLIDDLGNILFSSTNFSDTLFFDVLYQQNMDTTGLHYKMMDPIAHQITVPSGTFDALDYITYFIYPYNHPEEKTRLFHRYNAEGIGTVLETWGYAASSDIIEKRLVTYQIMQAIE